MPNISSRSAQLYTSASVSGTGGYSLDPFKLVGTDCNPLFNSLESLLTGSITTTLLYNGLTVADKDTGRRYVIQGRPSSWNASFIDNRRIWIYAGDAGAQPTSADCSDAYADDIFIDSLTGNVWKQTGTTDFESVYTLSSLISENISDTNYYPTAFTWISGTTNGPTGTLTGVGMPAVSFAAIPSAATDASGIVNTTDQTIAGAKTFTSRITGSNGLTITGGATNINVSDSTNAVNIGSGTTIGNITIGGTGAGQTIYIGAGAAKKTINIGNTTSDTAISISSGTGAIGIGTSVAKTITIGNNTGATALNLNTGTGGLAVLTGTTGAISIDSGTTGSISIGNGSNAKSITIGNNTTSTALDLKAGTGSMNITLTSDLNIDTLLANSAFNVNIGKLNTNTLTNIYIGNAGNIVIGSDLSNTDRTCLIYKTTQIGSSSNNKNFTTYGNIISTGFARAGLKSYSDPTSLPLNLSDGNTHYAVNTSRTSITLSIANDMTDLHSNYNGGSFIITIKNSHSGGSDLTVNLSDTEFYGFNLTDTVVLSSGQAMTYSGIIQGTGETDCYLYGIITPSAQNLMS